MNDEIYWFQLLFSIAGFVYCFKTYLTQACLSKDGITAEGKITSKETAPIPGDATPDFIIKYEFPAADGQVYEGKYKHSSNLLNSTTNTGDVIKIRYNKSNPAISQVSKKLKFEKYIYLVFTLFFLSGFIYLMKDIIPLITTVK